MAEKKNILTYAGLKQYEDELQNLKVFKRKEAGCENHRRRTGIFSFIIGRKSRRARTSGDRSKLYSFGFGSEYL